MFSVPAPTLLVPWAAVPLWDVAAMAVVLLDEVDSLAALVLPHATSVVVPTTMPVIARLRL
jgi:hypothetical protein